jgi:hypothetical protein
MARPAPVRRPLLNHAAAAAYIGCTPRQLRRWKEEGTLQIPVVHLQGRCWYEPEEIDRWRASLPRTIPNGRA